jgi:hypothetical protein
MLNGTAGIADAARDGEVPVIRNTRITAENVKRTVTYWRSGK